MISNLQLSGDVIDYVNAACSVLKCSPSELINEALRLHNHAFRIINEQILKSCELRDVENNNVC